MHREAQETSFRPLVSIVLISLDHYRTQLRSNNVLASPLHATKRVSHAYIRRRRDPLRHRQTKMLLINCAACAAPLAHDAPRCVVDCARNGTTPSYCMQSDGDIGSGAQVSQSSVCPSGVMSLIKLCRHLRISRCASPNRVTGLRQKRSNKLYATLYIELGSRAFLSRSRV